MNNFPIFMMTQGNAVPAKLQSSGVRGWVYSGTDGMQTAYWICEKDGVSEEHVHDFDEYFLIIDGEYHLEIDSNIISLKKGDEYHILPGVPHSGKFIAGTRTFHCFGGKRV